ncbi:MAG: Stk1 family PASTA domain-containing Ser/Thr kinase [Clostridiales bacterium]|nr:Stk1 family PASTA domain-containing Ser/Thr kinase [Clostridiales bacterium]
MLRSGTLLGNRYEIEKRIGCGGMADVYKAADHKLNRNVAVKVLKPELGGDSKFVSKFRIEAQSAAGLMHPNIVNVYDVGDDQGVSYMVMELVEGITLKDYIEKRGHLSAKEVISISIQVSNGIEAAHRNNIVHRDIKPQNIMISREGKVKVTDFGIARAATSNTISSNAMGSVHYTSPEQARGGYSDSKSDIYSLGITMYEMLTGDVPFDGDSTVTIALKHLQEEMIPPSEIVPDIPYSLEQIVLKCCQKSPDRRYQNMEELIADLKMSLINPDGRFVKNTQSAGDETVFFNQNDVDEIRKYERRKPEPQYDDYEYEDPEDDDDEIDDYRGYRDEYRRSEKNGMNKVVKVLLIVAILLIVGLGLFFVGRAIGIFKSGFGFGITADEDTVKVPNFLGMSFEEAQDEANKVGLGVEKAGEEESDMYDTNQVCKQSVDPGEKVEKNSTIELTISSGLKGEKFDVPDVKGRKQEEAEQMLTDAGFKVNSEFEESETVEEGYVISQNPVGGSTAGKNATITIKVSTGSSTASVPDLKGMTESQARKALNEKGLSLGKITEENSATIEEGQIIEQGTAPGTKVDKGTKITVVISKGDIPLSEQTWKCNANVNMNNYDGTYPVTIVLEQAGQETTIVENEKVSNPYNLSVKGIPGESEGVVTVYDASTGSVIGSATVKFSRVDD